MFDFGGAVGSFLGPILGNEQERKNAAEQHDWAVEDAQTSRGWQERMSNTAHQREVEDLKKAGLNPVLSGTGGAGASTPGGATATSSKAGTKDFGNIIASALEARMMKQNIENGKQELLNKKALEQQTNSATAVNAMTANKLQADKKLVEAQTKILSPAAFILDNVGKQIQTVPDKIQEHGKVRGEFYKEQERLNKLVESSRAVPRKFKQPDKPAFIPPKNR